MMYDVRLDNGEFKASRTQTRASVKSSTNESGRTQEKVCNMKYTSTLTETSQQSRLITGFEKKCLLCSYWPYWLLYLTHYCLCSSAVSPIYFQFAVKSIQICLVTLVVGCVLLCRLIGLYICFRGGMSTTWLIGLLFDMQGFDNVTIDLTTKLLHWH